MKSLRDGVAVVTGGGSGIGLALARALRQEGMRVALVDVHAARLDEASKLLDGGVSCHQADVSRWDEVQSVAEAIIKKQGPPSLLINAAGVSVAGVFQETSIEDFQWLMSINLGGTVHCCRAFLPCLLEQREAHIVNVSSCFGLVGFPGKTAYAASKFAVRGFTESLRMELANTRVGVTLLYPGPVATGLLRDGRAASEAQRVKEMQFLRERALSADRVAAATIQGIRYNRPRVLLSTEYRIMDWLARVSPGLAMSIIGSVGRRTLG